MVQNHLNTYLPAARNALAPDNSGLGTFFSLPMASQGLGQDTPVGMDELGRVVYEDRLGQRYTVGTQERQPIGPAVRGAISAAWANPAAAIGTAINALAAGAWNGISAPGRAARGEPVTYGDVMDTALDWGVLSAPMAAPPGALRSGAMANQGNPIFTRAREAADALSERYGVNFDVTTHPTSWGNSAYVQARVPGPSGTYANLGFRLSDHDVGEFRRATDGIPTIIYDDGVSVDRLIGEVAGQYDQALPRMTEIATRRAAANAELEAALSAWRQISGDARGAVAQAFQENRPRNITRPWRSLSQEERALFAYRSGLIGQ